MADPCGRADRRRGELRLLQASARAYYQATTQVYLGAASEEGAAPATKSSTKGQGAASSDQNGVINSIVVEQVRKQLNGTAHRASSRRAKVKAKASEKSQFITITAEAHTAQRRSAAREHDRAAVHQTPARRSRSRDHHSDRDRPPSAAQDRSGFAADDDERTKAKASDPRRAPRASSRRRTSNSKINQLEATLAIGRRAAGQTGAAPATRLQLSPKPRKNAIFGFVIGVVLASIAAYALGRLDRRLRSLVEHRVAVQARTCSPRCPKVRAPDRPSRGSARALAGAARAAAPIADRAAPRRHARTRTALLRG